MGKGLNELELKDEKLPEQSLDDLPQFGSFREPPQPGPYRFRLPAVLTKIWEVFDITINGKTEQRVRAQFDGDAPLTIIQAKDQKYLNESFETRVSNAERPRGKDKSVVASDMDYLLRALGEKARPRTNKAYIETFNKYGGKEFGADISFSWVCSDSREIYVKDAEGHSVKDPEGRKGCGKKYYQRDVPKQDNGEYPVELQCDCGAVVRAFANLDSIRS